MFSNTIRAENDTNVYEKKKQRYIQIWERQLQITDMLKKISQTAFQLTSTVSILPLLLINLQ